MTLKEKYIQFDKTAPLRTARLTHGSFTYRYYKNSQSPSGNITLVFLAGGTGHRRQFYSTCMIPFFPNTAL